MPTYDDPNLGSQIDQAQQQQGSDQAFADLLTQAHNDPQIQAALQSGGPDAATQLLRQKYGSNGLASANVTANGSINIPPGSDAFAWRLLGAVASLPFVEWGVSAAASALGGGAAGAGEAGAGGAGAADAGGGAGAALASTPAAYAGAGTPIVGGGSSLTSGLAAAGGGGALASTTPTYAGVGSTIADPPSSLMSALSAAGGGGAAPASLWNNINHIGQDLTYAGSGLASGRRADANSNIAAANANNNAGLNAAEFNATLPMTQAQMVARGDLMSHPIAPVTASGSGRNLQLSGGLSPSLFGARSQAAGNALADQTLSALQSGSGRFTPQIVNPTQPSAGENILGGAGLGVNILSILGNMGWL